MNKMLDDVRAKLMPELYQPGDRLRLVKCPSITGRYCSSSKVTKGQVCLLLDSTREEHILDATRVEPYCFLCTTCGSMNRDDECIQCKRQRLNYKLIQYPQPFGSFP